MRLFYQLHIAQREGWNLNQADHPSASLFSGLLEMVSDLVCVLSPEDLRVLYINSSAATIYGRAQEELTLDPALFISCVDEEDREILRQNLRSLVDLKSFSQEFRIHKPDGKRTWLKGRFRFVEATDDQPSYIGVTAKDVSKRVSIERQLEESLAFYHSLVESIPINIFRKDREGRIEFANKMYCDSLKMSLSELVGKTDLDLFPEMAGKYRKDDQWVLQTGLPFHDVESHPVGFDEMIYVEVLKSPVVDTGGRRIGIQGMFWDVTDRKVAEKSLRAAKELAESASRAKTEFLANVSHEIRTPMNGIIGITEYLLGSVRDKKTREYLGLIATSADSLLILINDILDYSKIEAGRIELESHRFALRDMLGDTLRSLAVRAHRNDLELVVTFDADVPQEIVGDVVRLRQVITNLVSNAIKFTHQGEIEFSVNCRGLQGGLARLEFSVQDSGIGIPPDKQVLIFREFEQADASTTRQYGGTGLGLAISAKLVALMGGTLNVESEAGEGSRFFFTADFHFDETADDTDGLPVFERLQGVSTLVAVENEKMRKSLTDTLRRAGLNTTATGNAQRAFELLDAQSETAAPFQLLLAEVDLKVDDGTVLIEWMRKSGRLDSTSVVLLCNTNSAEVDRVQLRISDLLIKPVKEIDLINSIARALGIIDSETTSDGASNEDGESAPLKILLAEDNLVNQKLAVAILEKQGHQVEVAENGRVAIEYVQRQEFDIILMDVQMPEMDGYAATKEIRRLQKISGHRIPIIALTAHASLADRQRCLAAGMDEYLSKPIRTNDLFSLIDQQTGRKSTISKQNELKTEIVSVVDWEQAFDTVGGERQLLRELITVFLKDLPQMLTDIESSILEMQAESLRVSANTLKRALTHLGGKESTKLVAELEAIGESEDLSKAQSVYNFFLEELTATCAEFKRFNEV